MSPLSPHPGRAGVRADPELAPAPGPAALVVADLGVAYRGTVAVEGVSFRLDPGELVALVGPNGAGKSSLLQAVAGLVPHTGRVERPAVAYVPQRADIDPLFPITVGQLVATGRRAHRRLGRRPRPADRAATTAALELAGLAGRAHHPLRTLSGGQLQRALLARAVAQEARLILLDEAFSGIDRHHTEALTGLLADLAAAGTAVLVATHDLSLARRRFPRCLGLNRGLVADGAPAEVLVGDGLDALFAATATATAAAPAGRSGGRPWVG